MEIATSSRLTVSQRRLYDLLWDYLSNTLDDWPGTDALTVEDVLRSYYRAAADQGIVPSFEELQRRHPELRKELEEFFVLL